MSQLLQQHLPRLLPHLEIHPSPGISSGEGDPNAPTSPPAAQGSALDHWQVISPARELLSILPVGTPGLPHPGCGFAEEISRALWESHSPRSCGSIKALLSQVGFSRLGKVQLSLFHVPLRHCWHPFWKVSGFS